jgi:putative DNA primase/helicase
VVNALLGNENVSSYSLQSLTDTTGYYRAMIANKLVNYASEINGNLQTSIFKQLVSGEPVAARLPYGRPMQLTQYAKLIFNCNELPKEVEHTNAYFRRFLIIPFDVTIPEHEQDKQLHTKIIENELSGVFNWVLEGLNRLLEQKRFSHCEAAKQAVEQYKTQSDSVKLFIQENSYQPSPTSYKLIKDLYTAYRTFCLDDGFKPVNKTNFIKRLQSFGVQVEKRNVGNVAFLSLETETF